MILKRKMDVNILCFPSIFRLSFPIFLLFHFDKFEVNLLFALLQTLKSLPRICLLFVCSCAASQFQVKGMKFQTSPTTKVHMKDKNKRNDEILAELSFNFYHMISRFRLN